MGLFGGFKAKFTRNSRSKDSIEQVVCTKYKIHSELEDEAPVVFKHNPRIRIAKPKQPLVEPNEQHNNVSSKHTKSRNDIRNDQISEPILNKRKHKEDSVVVPQNINKMDSNGSRSRPAYPIPEAMTSQFEINHEYEEPVDPVTSISSSLSKSRNKNNSLLEIPPLPKSSPPLLEEQDIPVEYDAFKDNRRALTNKFDSPIINRTASELKQTPNKNLVETREVIANNSLYFTNNTRPFSFTTKDDYEEMSPGEEHRINFPLSDKDLEPSTLILMTQPSVDASTVSESPKIEFRINSNVPTDQEEDFKVNFAKYDYQRNYSVSEDELSTNDYLDTNEYTSTGYTSHAASIFFGDDLEPPTPKPRQMVFTNDTPDEENC